LLSNEGALVSVIMRESIREITGSGALSLIGNYDGTGIQSATDHFKLTFNDNSSIFCECEIPFGHFMKSDFFAEGTRNVHQPFTARFRGEIEDGRTVQIDDPRASAGIRMEGVTDKIEKCTVHFHCRQARIVRPSLKNARIVTKEFHLTNCPFFILPDHGIRDICMFNEIHLRTPAATLSIICYERMLSSGEVKPTTKLLIKLHVPTTEPKIDMIARAICKLLSLAFRNTVDWIAHKCRDSDDNVVIEEYRNAYLYPYRPLKLLIPHNYLYQYLKFTLPYYLKNNEVKEYFRVIDYLLEAEHSRALEVKYTLMFMALEALRSKCQQEKLIRADEPPNINKRDLKEIIRCISEKIGQVDKEKKKSILQAIRFGGKPKSFTQIERFCIEKGVNGFTKEMVDMRHKLFHVGRPVEGTTRQKLKELYLELTHIVIQSILKELRYNEQCIERFPSEIEDLPEPYAYYQSLSRTE